MSYDELPVGAVVRLHNGISATIVEKPDMQMPNPDYPVIAVIDGSDSPDAWTTQGEFYAGSRNDLDIVDVVHYGGGAAPERVKAPIVGMVADALKPAINRIERTDVENFRTGNYTTRNALDQYQEIATRSAIYPGQGTPFGVMYAALGLAEAGEVQNKAKKGFRDDGMIEFVDEPFQNGDVLVRFKPITAERRAAIIKEMGGTLWYMAALAKEIGTTLSEVAGNNLEELCSRTERDTLRGDGDNR